MKPYYDKDGITIYNGDCLEVMKQFEDKSFDLILTDPPYGKSCEKGAHGFGVSKNRKYDDNWDSQSPAVEYFNKMFEVSKNQILFGGQYFTDKLPISNCWIIWDKKGNKIFDNPFADCELCWTSFRNTNKKIVYVNQGFIRDNRNEEIYHPTQKPLKVILEIIKKFTKENDLILDPFIGSGTTLVASKMLGRRAVGIEISEKYCEIAVKRLEEVPKRLDNFFGREGQL